MRLGTGLRTLLAVDGGNSKTDVALVREDGTVLARARGPAFTPQSSGVGAAIDAVDQAVRLALGHQAAAPYADLVLACVAGADFPVEEEALRAELLRRGHAADVVVRNDTFALLRAGASAPWGVAVVCGAGINCVGVAPDGTVARFPALGWRSGDWGGGLGMGEAVLWHAARAEDGRGPATALTAIVRECFGAATVEQVSIGLHDGRLPEDLLHTLVPQVLAAAAAGDQIAVRLVERQAEEVALMGTAALTRLGLLDTPTELVLGGGMLTSGDRLLTTSVTDRYAIAAPQAKLVFADQPSIVGAAKLGLDRFLAPLEAYGRLRDHFSG